MMLKTLFRSLLRQKYSPAAARDFLEACAGLESSTASTLHTYFDAAGKVKDIQALYYPTMTLAGPELVKKAANRVGLESPKAVE